MQVLTPTGYRDASTLTAGDEVCAFDANTGAPIVNHVEAVQPVDYAEWCRWWQVEETVPSFAWYRVNGTYLLFGEQSIWRNGTNVCHAKHLNVGDEIYDDADQPVAITSIEVIEDQSLIWYRFDIDGDHSYIIDGVAVHNASRYWVGGTGTWDESDTTHWAASSGGTGGASVPLSADAVMFDANLSGGTVTLNYGGTVTVQSITCGAMVGTLDNSVNNNNVTLGSFSSQGTAVRTLNMGDGTWTVTGSGWNMTTTGNMTFNANSSTIIFSGAGSASFSGGSNINYNIITIQRDSYDADFSFNGTTSIDTVNINEPCFIKFTSSGTYTISMLTVLGTRASPVMMKSSIDNITATISIESNAPSISYAAILGLNFTGGASCAATNSFDFGRNIGITITPPGSGGGAVYPRAGLQAIGEGLSR